MASRNGNSQPDREFDMQWKGSAVRIRQWYDTGDIAVWRDVDAPNASEWDQIMRGMALRHSGWWIGLGYQDWKFPGASASTVEAELRLICS